MYHDVFFVAFLQVLCLRLVEGAPPSRDSVHDKAHDMVSVGLLSTSPLSSFITTASESRASASSTAPPAIRPNRTPALTSAAVPHLAHSQTAAPILPASATNIQAKPVSPASEVPLPSNLSPITSPQTQGLSSQQYHPPSASPTVQDSTDFALAQPSISPSPTATTGSNVAPKIRYALIGVLAGVPALTILGFVITFRWRRARQARVDRLIKIPVNGVGLDSNAKEKKGTRISSFFGISSTSVPPERDRNIRKVFRPVYASSIHSTAGLAGVGAHLNESGNSTPPMIRYVKIAEVGFDMELEKKKANFDNPFGTPPPVGTGFVTAPSRVSPHFPPTPPLQLIQLPPSPLRQDHHTGQFRNAGLAISHPVPITNLPSTPRQQDRSRKRDQPREQRKEVKDPLPAHVHVRVRPDRPSSPVLLSPNTASNIRTLLRTYKRTASPDLQRASAPDARMSIATSVYGGIASPRIPVPKGGLPDASPELPYLASSPNPEQTPVLPYLTSPVSISEQRHGMGPVIVIEAASPTIDSESEYAETETGDEGGALYLSDRYSHVRRTGLVGSPRGFVPPSTTFSSVSSYSISGNGTTASSSASTFIPRESSASSAPALSSSGSDDSSVTITAAMMSPAAAQDRIRMRKPDPDGGRYGQVTRSGVSLSWLPKDFDELEREGMRGVAF